MAARRRMPCSSATRKILVQLLLHHGQEIARLSPAERTDSRSGERLGIPGGWRAAEAGRGFSGPRWNTACRRRAAWAWALTVCALMLLGQESIRDVILFPQLKPK